MIFSFWSGRTRAKIVFSRTARSKSSSENSASSAPVMNFSGFFTPASLAMKLTVFGLSPEITRNETPRFWRNSTVSRTFSRREFLSVTIAIGRNFSLSNSVSISPDLPNSASKSTRKPLLASSSTCFEICLASFRSSKFFKINSGAPNTTERAEFSASKVSPLNFRLEEKAIAFNTLKFELSAFKLRFWFARFGSACATL